MREPTPWERRWARVAPIRSVVRAVRRAWFRGKPKVFGLGLSRTGTTSLARALDVLGYRSYHNPIGLLDLVDGRLRPRLRDFAAHRAFTDTPVVLVFRELDSAFPGSKFILATRDRDDWLASCRHLFDREEIRRHEKKRRLTLDLYGSLEFDHEGMLDAYERHHREVRDHFRGRESDLLEMDICAGDGWEKLCPFLGVEVPEEEFPSLNARPVSARHG